MKRILCVLLAAMALQGIVTAQVVEPQPAWLAERVTIREGRLPDVLAVLERAGGFTVEMSADDKELLLQSPLTMRFTNAHIKDILKFALDTAGLSYKIVDEKTVQVFKPATP